MKQDQYRTAMDEIQPDADFEQRTLDKLSNKRKAPGYLRFAIPAAAVLACVLIVAIALPGFLPFGAKKTDTPQLLVLSTPAAGSTELPEPVAISTPAAKAAEILYDSYVDMEMATEEAFDGGMMAPLMSESAMSMGYYAAVPNTEEYNSIRESGFKSTLTSPLSTFAADVDTACYTALRRRLLAGDWPEDNAIRVEEMLNYFSYTDLAPEEDQPVKISTALSACPWNENAALLFVGVGAKQIETESIPRSNIVFLIDTSGSMEGPDRLDLIKRAFALLTQNLREGDVISIVTYAGSDKVELEGTDGSERSTIMNAIDNLTAWGSTNGSAGINTAYALAEKYFIQGGNNRVILMTDGDLNVGTTSEAALTSLIEEKKQSGVFLSVFGFGRWNLKDNKLEALADHGNGSYCYIDSITEARKSLVEQMGANFYTVLKDVKLQVEFNPAYVSSYRLIGYENRALAAEDFSNDTVDGGEMGSGHTVVALYELIPAQGVTLGGVTGTDAQTGEELRYQTNTTGELNEVALVKLRAKQPDGDQSSLYTQTVLPQETAEGGMNRNLSLASAIAEFGMLLRDSEYKGSATWDKAIETVRLLPNLSDEETELMYLITRAKQISAE